MKHKLLTAVVLGFFALTANAQTADEIIANYFENTGGIEKWKTIEGIKMSAKVNQGGMEIPLEIIQLKDGRQATIINLQGRVIKQGVFDGTDLWSDNFMTQKAEKSDAETTENFKLSMGDFPDVFLTYKEKGYKIELAGKETIEGTETFKLKLTKKPIKVDGQLTDDITFYYFDAENFVPLVVEAEVKSGPGKGQVSQVKYSDYQEISNGVLMPFSLAQGAKGGQSQLLVVTAIEVNPVVDAATFKYPEGQ
jgi:outer membrane lipoprotein-sorting protein